MWVRLPPAAPDQDAGPECFADPPDVTACVDHRLLAGEYAYLLGVYLGDGMLTLAPRKVWRLRITLDQRYPGIIQRCSDAIDAVADRRPGKAQKIGCLELYSNWKHWLCLFPQHGPGTKHKRTIQLAAWQSRVEQSHPRDFLAGLIHSDGCRTINRVKGHAYPRYFFTNHSEEIRALFTLACGQVGVDCRPNNTYHISVARRASVEILDSFIGPKA